MAPTLSLLHLPTYIYIYTYIHTYTEQALLNMLHNAENAGASSRKDGCKV